MIESKGPDSPHSGAASAVAQSVRDQIEALHAHTKVFVRIDPSYVRDRALGLLQLSCELRALAEQGQAADSAVRDLPYRAVTIREAALRPTSID